MPVGPGTLLWYFRNSVLRLTLGEATSIGSQRMTTASTSSVRAPATWDAKAAQVLEIYRWVLGERARPDFGMPLPEPSR
jgi:hypothetical protein